MGDLDGDLTSEGKLKLREGRQPGWNHPACRQPARARAPAWLWSPLILCPRGGSSVPAKACCSWPWSPRAGILLLELAEAASGTSGWAQPSLCVQQTPLQQPLSLGPPQPDLSSDNQAEPGPSRPSRAGPCPLTHPQSRLCRLRPLGRVMSFLNFQRTQSLSPIQPYP